MQRFRKSSTKWMQAYMACILATQVSLLPIAEAASGPTDNSTIQSGRGGSPQSAPNIGNVGAGSFNGAATYAVPIEVALGTGGVQPNLSLSYSSHAARGASWSSSMTPKPLCPAARASDRRSSTRSARSATTPIPR